MLYTQLILWLPLFNFLFWLWAHFFCREIENITEIEPQKDYVQRYQLVPVSEPPFNQQIYEQHGVRVRAPNDSPDGAGLAIPNNGTIYVTSQHPNAPENGLRFAAAPDIRFEDEAYATARYLQPTLVAIKAWTNILIWNGFRYEYQHGQHHSSAHNAHPGSNEDIKIELIRNQHALHGKVLYFLCILENIWNEQKPQTFRLERVVLTQFTEQKPKQIHIEDAHQTASQSEAKIQYTNLDVSPQNYYSITTDGYPSGAGSGFAYISTTSNKDYIYPGSPNTSVLYKGSLIFVRCAPSIRLFCTFCLN